jgi:Uma2 family endonuclease
METSLRWTSADLELMPDDGKRYEIIDGELNVSTAPHFHHQFACGQVFSGLDQWSKQTGLGWAVFCPGVIFAEDDDVIPDVVWTSHDRLRQILGQDGHFHAAPELVVEVLSFGGKNERRDREAKLKLYSRRGVEEYWIVNWLMREVDVFRREGSRLRFTVTLGHSDKLISPLLPGFECGVRELF